MDSGSFNQTAVLGLFFTGFQPPQPKIFTLDVGIMDEATGKDTDSSSNYSIDQFSSKLKQDFVMPE